MEFLKDFFEIDTIINLINDIEGLIDALINLFGTTFSWLGSEVLVTLGIGATIAIVLRILGR